MEFTRLGRSVSVSLHRRHKVLVRTREADKAIPCHWWRYAHASYKERTRASDQRRGTECPEVVRRPHSLGNLDDCPLSRLRKHARGLGEIPLIVLCNASIDVRLPRPRIP